MLAITLAEAKNIAIGLIVVFAVGSIAAAWIMKTIMQKLAVAAVLAVLNLTLQPVGPLVDEWRRRENET